VTIFPPILLQLFRQFLVCYREVKFRPASVSDPNSLHADPDPVIPFSSKMKADPNIDKTLNFATRQ
jgi:hypothetical protein